MDKKEVLAFLNDLSQDTGLSRAVRQVVEEIRQMLSNCKDDEFELKIDAALQKLEDLSLDPNLPLYTRTQIWNLTSVLESAKQ